MSTTSATMQVMLSGPPPRSASSIIRSAHLRVRDAQRLGQRLVADHAGQAVRAEQVAVAGASLPDRERGLQVVPRQRA
jgi:hypothetical protein